MSVLDKKLTKDLYSIGETAKILDIEQHVVRFWSNTFSTYIKPLRKAGERRYYRKQDIQTLFKIKNLVQTHKYSLEGVKIILNKGDYLSTEERKTHLEQINTKLLFIKSSIESFLNK